MKDSGVKISKSGIHVSLLNDMESSQMEKQDTHHKRNKTKRKCEYSDVWKALKTVTRRLITKWNELVCEKRGKILKKA